MRSCQLAAALLTLLSAPLCAAPQPQVLDDLTQAGPNGLAAGWDVVAFGAEVQTQHLAERPSSLKVSYKYTARDGVIYLLRRARLRTRPWNLELTVKGDGGGQLLGVLLRDSVDGEIFEYQAKEPLTETSWATRTIEPRTAAATAGVGNQQLDALQGGGGIRLAAVVIRRGPRTKPEGVLQIGEIVALCDVAASQATMIDIVGSRYDDLYDGGDQPQYELLVNCLDPRGATVDVNYDVTDAAGGKCGSGRQQVKLGPGESNRVPVRFQPRAKYGHFTVTAAAKAGNSTRHATARFVVIPSVPVGPGRRIGCRVDQHPGPAQQWLDYQLFRALQRSGVAFAKLQLAWAELEPSRGRYVWTTVDHFLDCSKQSGLPLFIQVVDSPSWAMRDNPPVDQEALAKMLSELARRVGDRCLGWEIWRQPNTVRYWPPEPQPYRFRVLLERATAALRAGGSQAPVISGEIQQFEPGFAGTLYSGPQYAVDHLGFGLRVPRFGFPLPEGTKRPSTEAVEMVAELRQWIEQTNRTYVAPWFLDVGVRTSPLDGSDLGQAVELARCAAAAVGAGGMMSWHAGRDGDDRSDRYGLFRRTLEPKPAVATLAAASAALYDTAYLGTPQVPNANVWVLKAPDGFLAVGFANKGNQVLPLTGVKATDVWGNALSGSIRVGDAPIYASGVGVAKLLQ